MFHGQIGQYPDTFHGMWRWCADIQESILVGHGQVENQHVNETEFKVEFL